MTTEEILKDINQFKKKFQFSLDIYYNDIDSTFVCKVHGYGDDLDENIHFRNKHLVDSLLDAYSFCKEY